MSERKEQALVISSNITRLREQFGWTQVKLANEAGITAAALSQIEKSGGGRVPTIVVLRKLASALNVKPSELTGEDESEKDPSDKTVEFYRRWSKLDQLPEEDQKFLEDMMGRFTKK